MVVVDEHHLEVSVFLSFCLGQVEVSTVLVFVLREVLCFLQCMIQSGRRIYCISFLIFILRCFHNCTVLFASVPMASFSSAEFEMGGGEAPDLVGSSDDEIEMGGGAAPSSIDWRKRSRKRGPRPLVERGEFWAFVVTVHSDAPKHRLVGIVNF